MGEAYVQQWTLEGSYDEQVLAQINDIISKREATEEPRTTTTEPQTTTAEPLVTTTINSQDNSKLDGLTSTELDKTSAFHYLSPLTTTMKPNDKEPDDFPEPEYYMEPINDYSSEPETPDDVKRRQDEYIDKIPDFSDPKVRISEIKCKEYIWGVEKRDADSEQVVIGGRDANTSEFPHMAAIGWATGKRPKWVFKCGGTLISDKFVLTAAHCTKIPLSKDLTVSDPVPKIVRLGVIRIDIAASSAKYDYHINKIIKHPNYKPPKQYYDIALLELNEKIPLFRQRLHPACLWSSDDTSSLGKNVTVTGWGLIKTGPQRRASPLLQVGEVEVIESETCHDLLLPECNRRQCGIKDHQICAGILSGGVDACQGDSGGPLQVKISADANYEKIYYVIGVTSFGIGCAAENLPGVYTRVSSFINWIEDIVWPNKEITSS